MHELNFNAVLIHLSKIASCINSSVKNRVLRHMTDHSLFFHKSSHIKHYLFWIHNLDINHDLRYIQNENISHRIIILCYSKFSFRWTFSQFSNQNFSTIDRHRHHTRFIRISFWFNVQIWCLISRSLWTNA